MRRTIILMLALMLIGTFALAETASLAGGVNIGPDAPVQIDLDGDGREESVAYAMIPDDFEPYLQLQITTADGTALTYDTGVIYAESAWACDINGDGLVEMFAWGDVMSDDYYTFCLHYEDGVLKPVLFADVERGENGKGYYKWGYGSLISADPEKATVTLYGSQDALGTYFMGRTLKLDVDGLFETADDGWWVRDVSDLLADEEAWEYGALKLKTSVPCEIDGKAEVLSAGDQIIITGTDKQTQVSFVARDGRTGLLAISEDYERGWGFLVDGVSEDDVFEYVPYAD